MLLYSVIGFPGAQIVKNPPTMQETWVWSLGWKDPLEEDKATHSSILAWRISWTEEPGGLQSKGSQRIGHDWATKHSIQCCIYGVVNLTHLIRLVCTFASASPCFPHPLLPSPWQPLYSRNSMIPHVSDTERCLSEPLFHNKEAEAAHLWGRKGNKG